MKKLKILELTNFSAGICGVWQRVKQESLELSRRGYEIRIFSSNAVKGSNKIANTEDKVDKIRIKRFPFKKIGGESFMSWNFEQDVLNFKPDIIIAHSYRHLHTTKALEIARRLIKKGHRCRVFLVTHAPFIKGNETRSFLASIIINLYDFFIGRATINKFDKIIAITKWEMPHLEKLRAKKEKIKYLPNALPEEFFKTKPKKGKNILFLGRISPVKNLEILIKAVKNMDIKVDIVGPVEQDYKNKLLNLMKNKVRNVRFFPAVYDLRKKIKLIDEHEIFVLPSKSEAMPQVLLEAMSRGKIVLSSNTPGGKEIIIDKKNGFLFKIGNEKQLGKILKEILKMPESEKRKIRTAARKKAEEFKWNKIANELEKLF